MENINVNEDLNEVVNEVITTSESGNVIKIAAGTGLAVLGCLAIYKIGKVANEKVLKPAVARFKASKEVVEEVIEVNDDEVIDSED